MRTCFYKKRKSAQNFGHRISGEEMWLNCYGNFKINLGKLV